MPDFHSWFASPLAIRLITAVVGLVIILVLVRLFQRALPRYVRDTDMRYRTRKFASLMGYVLVGLFLVSVFSDRLGSLTVAFGVVGAGIAFALQEVIASIAGWVAVSFGRFYKSGDRIQLGGIVGDVIDITVLRTTLMECGGWVKGDQYNGRIVRISNGTVFREPVYNYSADFPFLWDEITMPVRYGSDMREAQRILESVLSEIVGEYAGHAKTAWDEIVNKYRIEDAKVAPAVTMTLNENWIEFSLRYVVDYKERRNRKHRIFVRIMEEFQKTEGRVAIASTSTDINLTNMPPLQVNLSEGHDFENPPHR